MGLVGGKRIHMKSIGRHLTNREVYSYFKDCIVVKSRKSGEVFGRHFVSLDFMGDVAGPNVEVSHANFTKYLKRVAGRLNSESVDRHLANRAFVIIL